MKTLLLIALSTLPLLAQPLTRASATSATALPVPP